LIDSLSIFWEFRYHPIEGINWINRVLIASSRPGERAYAVGRTRAGFLSILAGQHVQATEWLEEAMPLVRRLDDRELLMHAAQALGFMAPDYEQSIQLEMEAIRLADELDWAGEKAECLFMLGRRMRIHGDFEGATRVLMDGVRLAKERQVSDLAYCLKELGLIAFEQGDYVQARTLLEESIVVGREWDDPNIVASSQLALAEVALRQQLEEEVVRLIKESITSFHKGGNLDRVAHCLSVAAIVAQGRGQLACAVRWLGAAAVVRRDFSGHTWFKPAIYAEYERRLAALREVVAPADFERAWAEGERMTLAQAVDEVLAME
jgi:tetratricopeptide (TPR) repeat protein